MVRHIAALVLAACVVGSHAQGQDFSSVEIEVEKLDDTTCMLVGAGGNIGLSVGEHAVFIIDDQFAPLAPQIKTAIAHITPKPVQFVLNTHFHFDHTDGDLSVPSASSCHLRWPRCRST